MDYRFEDTINGVRIEYRYEEMNGRLYTTSIYLYQGDLELRVLKGHDDDSLWYEPEISSFDLKHLKEAMYIFDNIDLGVELAKCKKCTPHRLWDHGYCDTPIDGDDREHYTISYSKVPDKKWDGIGVEYCLNIGYYYGEWEECAGRDEKEMNIIFTSKGEILEVIKSHDDYETKFDVDKLITKFLKYCRSEGVGL